MLTSRALAALAAGTFALALASPARAQARGPESTVIHLVRHAETAADGSSDPALSEAGRERAAQLARMMGGAGITAVPATPYARTRETARRVADALGPAPASVPAGRSPDVETVESIVAALYASISGPAGQPRDWDRLRSLFLPSARMIPVQRGPEGQVRYRALRVEEYIQGSGEMIESMGFREIEVARRVERFGDVAHVFSTYEGYREGLEEPILSGLNSIQLIHDGGRWWVASLAWSPATPDLPIPPRYQRDGGG